MITYRDFYRLVCRVRTAQREYFRYRSQNALVTARELEKLLDDAIGVIESERTRESDPQGTLFGGTS